MPRMERIPGQRMQPAFGVDPNRRESPTHAGTVALRAVSRPSMPARSRPYPRTGMAGGVPARDQYRPHHHRRYRAAVWPERNRQFAGQSSRQVAHSLQRVAFPGARIPRHRMGCLNFGSISIPAGRSWPGQAIQRSEWQHVPGMDHDALIDHNHYTARHSAIWRATRR